MNPFLRCLFLLSFVTALLASCRKDGFTDNPAALLRVGTDTVHFDTVLTTTGSVSAVVKIFNDNDKGIHVGAIRLGGGAASPFRINVDGTPGPFVNDVDIAGRDSAYIFVTVTINPSAVDLPFVVRDSIVISYKGNTSIVQLEAFGQNAHFFRNRVIRTNETWANDRPYVILGGITVDTNAVLTIAAGTRIYLHADAPFIVHGSLQALGDRWDSTRVVFTGDRLDIPYRDYPASYPGLFFSAASRNNLLRYTIVKNAYQGIVVAEGAPTTKLTLQETIIDNAYDAGLTGINTSISARNLLVSNCGRNIVLVKGGTYDFTHCTAAAISGSFIQHKAPVLLLTNNNEGIVQPLTALFRNCLFWGEANGIVSDEVVVGRQGSAAFNVSFENVLWRVQNAPAGVIATGIVNNQNPLFDSVNIARNVYSFRLKDGSPALNKGVSTSVNTDLDGKPRPVGLPDLGAYEKQ
jgi:hypothetical protein